MKPKDLNTYINKKLNEGSGLRYQEEYWNNMNGLLDANMPVVQPANIVTTTVAQTTSSVLKLSAYLISACAAGAAGVLVYFQFFATPASVEKKSQPAGSKPTITQSATQVPLSTSDNYYPTTTEETTNNNTLEQESQPGMENNGGSLPPDQTNQHTNSVFSEDPHAAEKYLTPATGRQTSADASVNAPSAGIPSNENLLAGTSDQRLITHSSELILIGPLTTFRNTTEMAPVNESSVKPPYHNRNRFIKHIDISPFAGMVFETGKQTYQSGNIEYIHPAQSSFTYGVNVECATNHFSVRTGIGLSTTMLQSTATTAEHTYDYDTSYIIVDPNYGTTPSGKPIALIKQKIDSTYLSTQYTTTEGTTTYQYLTIPLTIQYKIAHKRFLLMLEGGGLHHIMVSQQKDGTQQTRSENLMVLPTYSFQLTAGSSIRYAITSKWAVGVQYNYNLNPSSANIHFLNNSHAAVLMLTRSIR